MSKLAGATLLSRRLLLGGNEASAAHYAPKLSVEVYIWIQHLASEKKTLAEGVEEVLASFHGAGYRRVELNQDFFKPELRERTLALLAKYQLGSGNDLCRHNHARGRSSREINQGGGGVGAAAQTAWDARDRHQPESQTRPSPKDR